MRVYFIRDFNLAKDQAELLLLPGRKVMVYGKRYEKFWKYFSSDNDVDYCNDIEGLLNLYKKMCICQSQRTDVYKPVALHKFFQIRYENSVKS